MARCKKCEAEVGTTLLEEVEYWINDKKLVMTESEKDSLVEEVIRRWDELADEDIEEILEGIKAGEI